MRFFNLMIIFIYFENDYERKKKCFFMKNKTTKDLKEFPQCNTFIQQQHNYVMKFVVI